MGISGTVFWSCLKENPFYNSAEDLGFVLLKIEMLDQIVSFFGNRIIFLNETLYKTDEGWGCLCWSESLPKPHLFFSHPLSPQVAPRVTEWDTGTWLKIVWKIKTDKEFPNCSIKAVGSWEFFSSRGEALRALWNCWNLFLVQICEMLLLLNSGSILSCVVKWHFYVHLLVARVWQSVPKYKESDGWHFFTFW